MLLCRRFLDDAPHLVFMLLKIDMIANYIRCVSLRSRLSIWKNNFHVYLNKRLNLPSFAASPPGSIPTSDPSLVAMVSKRNVSDVWVSGSWVSRNKPIRPIPCAPCIVYWKACICKTKQMNYGKSILHQTTKAYGIDSRWSLLLLVGEVPLVGCRKWCAYKL